VLVIFLNIFDLAATFYWCQVSGTATEANPLLYRLITVNPAWAAGFKLLMVSLFTVLMLVAARLNIRLAYRGTLITGIIYLLVAGWHLTLPVLPAILTFAYKTLNP
jgi:hypothetical protein